MPKSIEEYRERLRQGTTEPLPRSYANGTPEQVYLENSWRVEPILRARFARQTDDVVQGGHLGCWLAARRFDPARGNGFAAFGTSHIRAYAGLSIDQSRLVSIPADLRWTERRDKRLSEERLAAAAAARDATYASLGPREEKQLEVADHHRDEIDLFEIRDELATYLDRLKEVKPRHYAVLAMRFGLDGETPLTLIEIGRKLGVNKERVRQLEDAAIQYLQAIVSKRH